MGAIAEADNGIVCGGRDSGCDTMGVGDGDCDSDSECHAGLKCGKNNCGDFRPSSGWPGSDGTSWDTGDDCCYKPGRTSWESDYRHTCTCKDGLTYECESDKGYDAACCARSMPGICGQGNIPAAIAGSAEADNGIVCGGRDSG